MNDNWTRFVYAHIMAAKFVVFRVTLFSIVLVMLIGCTSSKKPAAGSSLPPSKVSEQTRKPSKKTPPPATPPEAHSGSNSDVEIKAILDLANKNEWEKAEMRATVLFEKSPKNEIGRAHV